MLSVLLGQYVASTIIYRVLVRNANARLAFENINFRVLCYVIPENKTNLG